ncbi:MAG: hypothetical protein KatS3mg042_1376 [Rhodothermaceae bacterium]|nr:MAG: hypothetical protein KatS3mg042_1376 [Rhodothermaceae bacterium]
MDAIKQDIRQLADLIAKGEQWLRDFRPEQGARDIERFGQFAARQRALERACDTKPAIGLFGESQVGKSFLVNALLKGNGPFKVQIHPDACPTPFQEINPRKETEATAVVTRFGKDPRNSAGPTYYRVSLLTVGTLMRCIFEGFNLEVARDERERCFDDEAAVKKLLDVIKANSGKQLSPEGSNDFQDNFLQIKDEYFKDDRKPSATPVQQALQVLREHGSALTVDTAIAAASLLWLGFDELAKLYGDLVRTYTAWGEPEEVYLPQETLQLILDTQYLRKYGSDEGNARTYVQPERVGTYHRPLTFKVVPSGDGSDLSVVQLFAREIYLQAAPGSSPLLDRMDVLDFPGMMPFRDSDTTWSRDDFKEGSVERLVHLAKMGKLKYLFRKATDDYEVPILLFCIPPYNAKTPQLTNNVRRWLDSLADEGVAVQREALFTVMTKSDEVLKTEADLELAKERWKVRFTTNFEHEYTWVRDLEDYSNIYLVRNTTSSLYNLPDDLSVYKEAFFDCPHVERYLKDRREASWEALTGDQGGVDLLRDALIAAAETAPQRWHAFVRRKVRGLIGEVRDTLRKYYVPADEAERIKEQREAAQVFLKQLKKHYQRNLPELLIAVVEQFPDASWARAYEPHDTDSFLPRGALQDARDFREALLDAFEENLLAVAHNIADERLKGVESEALARFIRTMMTYFRHENQLTEQYLSKNRNVLGSFSPPQRLMVRDGLCWILMQQITYLGHPPGHSEPDPAMPLDTYLPHDALMQHWVSHLPDVYDRAIPQRDLRGNEELEQLLSAPLFAQS